MRPEAPKRTTYKERARRRRAERRARQELPKTELERALFVIDHRIKSADAETVENLAYRFFLKSVEKMLRAMNSQDPLPPKLQEIFTLIRSFNLGAMDYGKIGALLLERASEMKKPKKPSKKKN
jgi:hypothetical protein